MKLDPELTGLTASSSGAALVDIRGSRYEAASDPHPHPGRVTRSRSSESSPAGLCRSLDCHGLSVPSSESTDERARQFYGNSDPRLVRHRPPKRGESDRVTRTCAARQSQLKPEHTNDKVAET